MLYHALWPLFSAHPGGLRTGAWMTPCTTCVSTPQHGDPGEGVLPAERGWCTAYTAASTFIGMIPRGGCTGGASQAHPHL